jgi:hypothetical protein
VAFLIGLYLRPKQPVGVIVVYLFITMIAVLLSIYISNVYEQLMTNEVIGQTLMSWTGPSTLMLQLPIWTSVIGLIGLFLLIMGSLRDKGAGGRQVDDGGVVI